MDLKGFVESNREYYKNLSWEEKRKLYICGENYITLDDIDTWPRTREELGSKSLHKNKLLKPLFSPSPLLNTKVSLWHGDITRLEIDAIVNASNFTLLGNAGMNGAVHKAAGSSLYDECVLLGSCDVGDTKITSGHALPAEYILHTVGPQDGCVEDLENCYWTCLDLVKKNNIKSVAFPCIATGKCEYGNEEAADTALGVVRKWLERNAVKVDRIIFCVFLEKDWRIYCRKLLQYFPEKTERKEDLLEYKEEATSTKNAAIIKEEEEHFSKGTETNIAIGINRAIAPTGSNIALPAMLHNSTESGSSKIESTGKREAAEMNGDSLSCYELLGVQEVKKGEDFKIKAGSYGFVYEVEIWGTTFIAKKPHAIFMQESSSEEMRSVMSKFREECTLMSTLRHPNIVQFIGIYYGDIKKTDLILVMEKMEYDLLEFMSINPRSRLSIKLSILQDVASGLVYLHEHDPPIVHRDVTAMNILLTQFHRAKIADVGMSKLIDHKQMTATHHTCVPGQLFYMPPETRFKRPQCTPKLDIFSYGHLTLHLMLENFPEVYDLPYHDLKEGMVECQRRETSLSAMGSGHCLYRLVIDCLRDEPLARPNAHTVLAYIKQLMGNNK